MEYKKLIVIAFRRQILVSLVRTLVAARCALATHAIAAHETTALRTQPAAVTTHQKSAYKYTQKTHGGTVNKKQQEKHVCVRRHTPTGISLRQLVRRRRVKWRLQFVAKQQQPQQHYPPVWRQACLPARLSSDAAPTSHKSVAITVLPGFYHTRVSYC